MKKPKTPGIFMLAAVFLFSLINAAEPQEPEKNQQINAALYHYYSGETEEAKKIAAFLKESFPEDPFFNELLAEIIWQELEKEVAPGQQKYKRVDYKKVRENRHLVEQFHKEIFEGLVLTRAALEQNSGDSRNLLIRGMLLVRQAGFIAKFESGLKSYSESDEKMAEGTELIRKSIELDRTLCSAKYIFALGKYSLIRGSENLLHRVIIMLRSRTFTVLGDNFNFNDVIAWLREAMSCESKYYFTKDIEIDKKFVYQDILIGQAGKYDEEILPVLEELHSRFPGNGTVKNNLFLARLHLKRKMKGP